MKTRTCKACSRPIADKTRSKFCKEHRGPNTHGIKPTARFFVEAST